ncbi:MAG: aminotransferase class I/II-fold pyridoxal phosphate-dependent enzyme [Vicinamibacterales bacterium]
MSGYTPGEQPRSGERVIKLNTNENPYPPSPKVFEAIGRIAADALRRYPQPMADDFRHVAARVHGVAADRILAGNGSDDILQIALRSYCGPGDVLASPEPTYSLYPGPRRTGGRPLRYSSVGTRLVAPVGCAPGRESAGDLRGIRTRLLGDVGRPLRRQRTRVEDGRTGARR